MKKVLFIMMAIMMSISVYAERNETTEFKEVSSYENTYKLAEIDVTLLEVFYPYVIEVNNFSETIVNISGPCLPSVYWYMTGSTLNISLLPKDFLGLSPGMKGYVYIHTQAGICYYIEINCQ